MLFCATTDMSKVLGPYRQFPLSLSLSQNICKIFCLHIVQYLGARIRAGATGGVGGATGGAGRGNRPCGQGPPLYRREPSPGS